MSDSRFSPSSRAIVALVFCAIALIGGAAHAKPPTVDPTYGLPLPASMASRQHLAYTPNWIWVADTEDYQTVYMRRTFTLSATPRSAEMYVNADDYCIVYVNGQLQPQTARIPGGLRPWEFTRTFDIAASLKSGKNVVAIVGVSSREPAGVVACIIAGQMVSLLTDHTWKVSTSVPTTDDWTGIGYDDSSWIPATEVAPIGQGIWQAVGTTAGWPTPLQPDVPYLSHIKLPFASVVDPNTETDLVDASSPINSKIDHVFTVTPAADGSTNSVSLLLDLGEEIAGRVVIKPLDSGQVVISRGESADEAINEPFHGPTTLVLTPGVECGSNYSGFRYVNLSFSEPPGLPLTPIRFEAYVDHKYYPVQYKGSFDCSDQLLTKIWYTGAYTCHLCMQEDIWDGIKRDRRPWIGDLHVSGEVINNVFADKFLMEETLTRLINTTEHGNVNDLTGYSCAWICTLADFHRHIGDYKFLDSQHEHLLYVLSNLTADLDSRGVFTHSPSFMYTDWSPDFFGDNAYTEATTHLFFAKAVDDSVFLFKEMGDTKNAQKYAKLAAILNASAHKYLVGKLTNTYSNRLQENAMAICSGVATPAQKHAIYADVLTPSSPSWNRDQKLLGVQPVMSPYYGNYIIFSMSMAGHTGDALKIVRNWWGGMVNEGATTFWEAYDPMWPKKDFHKHLISDFLSTGYYVSLCHGWSSGPTSFLTERVLGVRPTGGGFKTVEIAPDLGGLAWAEGTVPTPRGGLKVRAEASKTWSTITIDLPSGTDATVRVPGSSLKVNGKPAQSVSKAAVDYSKIEINRPGHYVLTSLL